MVIGCLRLSDASAICRIVNVRRTSQKIRGSFLFFVLPWPCILPLWLFISFFSFFFFFFFRRLISEVTERISTKLGHIIIYLWLLKIWPNGLGVKTAFWDRIWNISAMEHDINNRKEICQSTGTPLHVLPIWRTLAQKRLRTVGEFLLTP